MRNAPPAPIKPALHIRVIPTPGGVEEAADLRWPVDRIGHGRLLGLPHHPHQLGGAVRLVEDVAQADRRQPACRLVQAPKAKQRAGKPDITQRRRGGATASSFWGVGGRQCQWPRIVSKTQNAQFCVRPSRACT